MEQVDKKGLNKNISFPGEVERDKLVKLYNCADAFIMASVTDEGHLEGTPMSMLEAMACSLPVITTSAGGIEDVIADMKNGLVIEEKNKDSIASAVKLLYNNRRLYSMPSDNALMDIKKKFSLDIVIRRVLEIYEG